MARVDERGTFIFKRIERDLSKLASDPQAEHVHRFRTAARRLQILLKLILPEQGRKQKKLLKRMNRIRRRAGKVRDLDVQLAALRSLKVPLQPRRKTQLIQEMLQLRAEHEKNLLKLLSKSEVRDLSKRLRRAAKSARFERMQDPLRVAKQVLQSTPRAATVDDEVLHRYRLAVKRARYAAEFAAKSAESAEFIRQLRHLQDSLGHWHDWVTLTDTATQRIGEVNQSPLVAAIRNVTGGKFRNAVADLSASPLLQSPPPPPARRPSVARQASAASAA